MHALTHHIPLLLRSLFAYALLVGLFALVALLLKQPLLQPTTVSTYTPVVTVGKAHYVKQGVPVRIAVDRLNINLPIDAGTYDAKTGEWTLSDTSAYFATITDLPNELQGSTFIYGHNRQTVFAPLARIQSNDEVKVTTDNGYTFSYRYLRDASVNPDMTAILYEHPKTPQLVLMTCEGVWSSTRRIMYFTLTGVS